MRKWIAIATAAWTVTQLANAAPPDSAGLPSFSERAIHLRSATIETDTVASLKAPTARFAADRHYVLQLDGPLTPERAARLEAAGIDLGAYLPRNAYLVRGDKLPAAALAAIDFVRWVGEYSDDLKLDPEVGARLEAYSTPQRVQLDAAGKLRLTVTLFAGVAVDAAVAAIGGSVLGVVNASMIGDEGVIDVIATADQIGALLASPLVQYVEDAPEITQRNSTTRWIIQSNVTNVTPLYANGLHGEGQVLGLLDGQLDVNHCSFRDTQPIGPTHRKILAYNTSLGANFHGTHCGGTGVGDAGNDSDTRGIAYAGKLVFNVEPAFNESAANAALTLHHNQGARVHSNSWGDDGTTAYNSLCRGFDVFMYDNEDSLACIAVTNTSALKNPENAKNILAVGASQDTPSQANHCSGGTGPTSDGRRKPEVYAPGCATSSASSGTACGLTGLTGTSMATPAVSGLAMLIRQYFIEGFYPTGTATIGDEMTPTAALLRAMLINSSVDMTGVAGYPSNREGWGRVLADNVLYFPAEARKLFVEDIRNASGLTTGVNTEHSFQVLNSAQPLRITLAWTEPAATSGAAFAQVNDLDLEVESPTGDLYRGNFFSGGVSTPGGTRDDRNNAEQVHLNSPSAGTWTVRIRATAVNVGTQGYSLVATGDIEVAQPPFTLSLPNGVPDLVAPGFATEIDVRVVPGSETLVGVPTLAYRFDGGSFTSADLTPLGGELYRATLPPANCAATPEFYFSATGSAGTVRTLPPTAPAALLTAEVGEIVTIFSDDFQASLGWTVSSDAGLTAGTWQQGTPVGGGTRGDPATDADGSGACFVTDNRAGDSDIDGGATRLLSPVLELSGGDAEIAFSKWFSNNFGGSPNEDVMLVQLSNDDGASWTTVAQYGPADDASGGWTTESFRVGAFVPPTALVRVRFTASDIGGGSVVEAGVDAFRVTRFECVDALLPGDMNCDGAVTVSDIAGFVLAVTDPAGYTAAFPACNIAHGDVNGDSSISVGDIGPFVLLLSGG